MRPIAQTKGHPLIRQKPRDLALAGIVRAPRLVGVRSGKPLLEDGRVLAVTNVVWATGFDGGLDFVKLPIFDERHEVIHDGGIVRAMERRWHVCYLPRPWRLVMAIVRVLPAPLFQRFAFLAGR
jgi:putative flavoprotein involved in K+ transport